MQKKDDVKKGTDSITKRIEREIFWWKLKKSPVIGQFICFPKCPNKENESNSEEIKLWTLSLYLVSAIITKNEKEQDEIRKEMLDNKIMQEPRAKEFSEYLVTLEYSKKESVDNIFSYVQKIFMLE